MKVPSFISIDQNSHTLWDTVPKLDALAAKGYTCLHCLEDVDVAFTRHGTGPRDESALELVPERYYRGGASDWGAALFYSHFLGRLPLDVRDLEPYTGWTTAALSRRLGCSVDELYDRYSPSDNWQLIGASYADAERRTHRVIGDLRLAEVAPFVRELFARARRDMLDCLPERAAQQRVCSWFEREYALVEGLLERHSTGGLIDLYRDWMQQRVRGGISLGLTSDLFSIRGGRDARTALLDSVVAHYDAWVEAYNEALRATDTGLKPLQGDAGELPFVAVFRHGVRWQRADVTLAGGAVECAGYRWELGAAPAVLPLEAMARDGVVSLVGKALLLVLQVRQADGGASLVLPHQGSLYMPAAHALEGILRQRGLLAHALLPVYRVRLRFLEHWAGCRTLVRPPVHVRRALGIEAAPAEELASALALGQEAARRTLEQLRDKTGREALMEERFPEMIGRRGELEARRRELARTPEGRSEAGEIWDHVKELDRQLLEKQVEWVLDLLHLVAASYYDSRGALQPWSVGLGTEALYQRLVETAEIYPEPTEKGANR